jgi:hypothetical protein
VAMPTCSVLHMSRRPAKFFEGLPDAKTIAVDKRLGLSGRFYDLSSVGFHARATDEDYDGHMHVVGDWHRYDLEDMEAALAQGLLMQVRNGRKRMACLDYGLDATHVVVDHACWDSFAAMAHEVRSNMKLVEVGTFYFDAPVGVKRLTSQLSGKDHLLSELWP